jgi:hypothetical protein
VFNIFVVKLISKGARNKISSESEANLDDGVIGDTLVFKRVIEIEDYFPRKFDNLVQWMEFGDLVNFISEDLYFVL